MDYEIQELNDATQYATVYLNERPVATLQRRRVYEHGPEWQIYDPDGRVIGRIWFTRSYDWLASRVITMVRNDRADQEHP